MAGITLRGLSKSFSSRDSDVAAVADVDLEIKDNSFVTLLGPSGCGKTTTLRLIAGYIAPDRGTIEVDGRLLSSPGSVVPPESRGMGMVFQNYAIWPHKNVFENVVFGLKIRKVPTAEARRKVEEALALVNLSGLEAPLSERAVRRPAAARRARPLAGGRARHPAARRAAVEPRRQAARAHALGAEGIAAPHRHHLRLRHPRPGRGAGALGPDRGDESRAACSNTARRSRSTPIPPTAWWRTSWGW